MLVASAHSQSMKRATNPRHENKRRTHTNANFAVRVLVCASSLPPFSTRLNFTRYALKYSRLKKFLDCRHLVLHCVSMGFKLALNQGLYELTVLQNLPKIVSELACFQCVFFFFFSSASLFARGNDKPQTSSFNGAASKVGNNSAIWNISGNVYLHLSLIYICGTQLHTDVCTTRTVNVVMKA